PPMRAFIAILFSVVLMGNPMLSLAAVSCVQSQTCCDCHCGKMNCCMKETTQDSKPAPGAPVRTVVERNILLFVVLLSHTLEPSVSDTSNLHSSFRTPLKAELVPLYTRNCSYLI